MEDTGNDCKQILHEKPEGKVVIQGSSCLGLTCTESAREYLYILLTEVNDWQSFPDCFPVTFVIDGVHFGTRSLEKQKGFGHDSSWQFFLLIVCFV